MSLALLACMLAASAAPPPCSKHLVDAEVQRYRTQATSLQSSPDYLAMADSMAKDCAGRSARACAQLAQLLRSPKLEACAERALNAGCTGGRGDDCLELANLLRSPLVSTKENAQRAVRAWGRGQALLEKGCVAGSTEDCDALASRLPGLLEPGPDALHLLELLCDRGEGRGCEVAGAFEKERNTFFLEKGCTVRHPSASACESASRLYQEGAGVAVDLRRANDLRRKACELDPRNCPGEIPICGNGHIEHGFMEECPPCRPGHHCSCARVERPLEECDGSVVPGTCESLGYAGGLVRCSARCQLDPSGCQIAAPRFHADTSPLPLVEGASLFADSPAMFNWSLGELRMLSLDPQRLRPLGGGPPPLRVPVEADASGGISRIHSVQAGGARLIALEQFGRRPTTTWVVTAAGFEGPVANVKDHHVLALEPGPVGSGVALLLAERSIREVTPHGEELSVAIEGALVSLDGNLRGDFFPISRGKRQFAANPAAAIAVPGGFLAAIGTNPNTQGGPLELSRVDLQGRVAPVDAWREAGSSVVLSRDSDRIVLAWVNHEGTFFTELSPGGAVVQPRAVLGPPVGYLFAVRSLRGGGVAALAGSDQASVRLLSAVPGARPMDEIVLRSPGQITISAIFAGDDALIAWMDRQPSLVGHLTHISGLNAPR